MKQIAVRNAIIVLIQIGFIIPYNYFFGYFAAQLKTTSYVAVILYALMLGASLRLMDLSNKKINIGLTAFYLIFSIINIQFSFFTYGPTVYLFILMTGALFASVLRSGK